MKFKDALSSSKILLMDGAMGTMLQLAGMPAGVSPDMYCLANPDKLRKIHNDYIKAGADIITTCTFGANSFKMETGLDPRKVNRELAAIAKECAVANSGEKRVFVAGDVGPTGFFAKPLGDVEPEEMIKAFAEQICGLYEGGCDAIIIETQFDLAETRLAVAACRRICDLPVMVSMTFEDGACLTGSTPEIFADTMQNMGVDAIGTNCSLGPVEMLPVVEELLSISDTPVLVQPNAGLPLLDEGKTVFPLDSEEFAEKTVNFAKMGAKIVGGCCGTTPAHIHALAQALKNLFWQKPFVKKFYGISLTSRSECVRISEDEPLVIIGERINPTGKPKLASEFQNDNLDLAFNMADEQIENGAKVLDINVGAPLIDEKILLTRLVCGLIQRLQVPLSIDSPDYSAIAASIPYYPGSCLVNSINGEKDRMDILGPLCRDFGSPFILLPLTGAELPATAKAKIAILEKLLEKAEKLGIPRRLILIDILALAVSATPNAAKECLKLIQWCRENHLPSTIGLSNISFGMPARSLLNSVFLAMARGMGLTSCIANPGIANIRQTVDAMGALEGRQTDIEKFTLAYASWKPGEKIAALKVSSLQNQTLYDSIVSGDKAAMKIRLEEEISKGSTPMTIINEILIPAINNVGEKFSRKEYFLPQLIRSAETMKEAFETLSPLLKENNGTAKKPAIILATVEGDIHDIGKNIVALLLGNYGYEVIDAGKDVPAGKIVELAEKHNAFLIGLSALMTTTMTRMADTINLVREKGLPIKVIVGGAAVTQDFANSIGADQYCETAVESVEAAKKFLSEIEN